MHSLSERIVRREPGLLDGLQIERYEPFSLFVRDPQMPMDVDDVESRVRG